MFLPCTCLGFPRRWPGCCVRSCWCFFNKDWLNNNYTSIVFPSRYFNNLFKQSTCTSRWQYWVKEPRKYCISNDLNVCKYEGKSTLPWSFQARLESCYTDVTLDGWANSLIDQYNFKGRTNTGSIKHKWKTTLFS